MDATSAIAHIMLTADQGRVYAYDLGADLESSSISTSNVPRLQSTQCYSPQWWIEARLQLRGAGGILGALLGTHHPVVLHTCVS
jgi:hypothetical protein